MLTQHLAPDSTGVKTAAQILRAGGLVAFPTETVYGLGADARNSTAVAKIFATKKRPEFNPLIAHLPDQATAENCAVFSDAARALAGAFWPGPLTLVLRLRGDAAISPLVTAGRETIGLRVPDADLARALLQAFGGPVAAPSANLSGRISPTRAGHVRDGLDGRIDAVIDGGACGVGIESTIVDLTGAPRLLRPGGIATEDIEDVLGINLKVETIVDETTPTAPGQLASHYAPSAKVRMNAEAAEAGEVLLGFGPVAGATRNLSEAGDLVEAAANLFADLHALDGTGSSIAVSPIPDTGLGRAINDRLRRAAAPRDQ
ncbi:MAG: L-threonylcarbamoyladenylate synthase [Pseudomonadota bacterium]